MKTISSNDWTDLGTAERVAEDLADTAPNDKAERLARAAHKALAALNAYIADTTVESSVWEHIWNKNAD